jgi:hypothetical protein
VRLPQGGEVSPAVAWLEDTYARGELRRDTIGLADLRTYVHRARRWPWVMSAGEVRPMLELVTQEGDRIA